MTPCLSRPRKGRIGRDRSQIKRTAWALRPPRGAPKVFLVQIKLLKYENDLHTEKHAYFNNCSLKGSLRNQKFFFYGIENTLILKSVATTNCLKFVIYISC